MAANYCEVRRYCEECEDNLKKGCWSEDGYCVTRKYCEECGDCE